MTKYKLKKDLTIAKAGEIVVIQKNYGNNPTYIVYKYKKEDKYRTGTLLASIDEKDLDLWFEEFEREKKSVFNLKEGDDYYILLDSGTVYLTNWRNNSLDEKILYANNVFLTEEEAETELKKRQAIVNIKKYCWENGIEFADKKYISDIYKIKYYISYNIAKKNFIVDNFLSFTREGFFIFKNNQDVLQVIKNCEDDLKIIFDV